MASDREASDSTPDVLGGGNSDHDRGSGSHVASGLRQVWISRIPETSFDCYAIIGYGLQARFSFHNGIGWILEVACDEGAWLFAIKDPEVQAAIQEVASILSGLGYSLEGTIE